MLRIFWHFKCLEKRVTTKHRGRVLEMEISKKGQRQGREKAWFGRAHWI